MAREDLIQPRSGTTAQWASPDDNILENELVYNKETNELKMGNAANDDFPDLPAIGRTQDLQSVTDEGATTTNNITTQSFTSSGTRAGGDLIVEIGDYDDTDTGAKIKVDVLNSTVSVEDSGSARTQISTTGITYVLDDGSTTQSIRPLDSSNTNTTIAKIAHATGVISLDAGDWNASTNTPTLANTDTGVNSVWYTVSDAGTVDFGAGDITFAVGDIVANNGTIWYKKVDNNQSGGGSSPLTTKGDIYTYTTTDARLGVGGDGTYLKADSTEPTGLIWDNPATASFPWIDITEAPYSAVADSLGDSGVDSTTAFTDAIAALQTAGGGVLYFPNTGDDRFNITVNHLTKRDMTNIKIMSFGTGRIFVKDTIGGGGSGQGRGVLVNMDDGTENFTIENMDILVSSGAFRAGFNTGVICSEEGNLRDITIRNCKIKNESKADTSAGVDGITFYRDVTDGADTATITNLVIEDCDIDLYGESVYGIQILRKTYYTNIYHNEVRLRAYTSTTDQAFNAIAMYGDSEYYNIELNYVYSSGHSGIAASMAENGFIRHNWVFNVLNPAEGGIEIEYKESHGSESIASNGTQVYGNYVEGCYYNIMVVQRDADATTYAPFDCIISNNRLRNAIVNDIVVASVFIAPAATELIKNIKILNNDIDSTATGAAIYIYDAVDTTINGNQIRNSAYGIRLGLNSTVRPTGFIEANGNHIYDVTNDAIRVFDMEGLFTADNNKIYNPGSRGIYSNAIAGTPRYKWTNNYCEGAIDGFRSTNDRTAILGCTFTNNTAKDCTGYGHNYANDNSSMTNNISDNCTTADVFLSTGGTTTPNIDY